MELNKLFPAILIVLLLGVLIIIGIVIFVTLGDTFDTDPTSDSQIILSNNGTETTLSPIGDGITSSSFTRLNDTHLDFDGVDDFVSLPVSSLAEGINNNFSIAMNVLFLNNTLDNANDLISINYNFASDKGFYCRTDSPSAFLKCFFGSSNVQSDDDFFISNEWVHLVVSYNGNSLFFYRDGIFNNSYSIASKEANLSHGTYVGANSPTSDRFRGSIDPIKFYDFPLGEEDAEYLYLMEGK